MKTNLKKITLGALVLCAVTISSTANAFEFRHVFVVNRMVGGITELDQDFNFVRNWFVGQTLGTATLNSPNGLAFTGDGQLFIADSNNNRVVVVDGNGVFVREWSTAASLGNNIESLNFDLGGVLYASANPGLGNIARFSQTGELLSQVVSGNEWLNLGNVNFTPNGQLIISPFNELGQGFRVVDRMTGQSTEPAFFTSSRDLIEDMALDGAGVLYASVFSADRVSVFNVDRTFRRDLQAPGLDGPTGIAINYRCEIIVASFYTQPGGPQIFVFSPEGEFLRSVVVPELGLAESIAIVGQILPGSFEFPPAGNELTPACDNFEPPVPFDGSLPDVGPRDSGAGDSAVGPGRGTSGCGCRVQSATNSNLLWLGLGLVLLTIRRQRS